jgi:hypothetical protein
VNSNIAARPLELAGQDGAGIVREYYRFSRQAVDGEVGVDRAVLLTAGLGGNVEGQVGHIQPRWTGHEQSGSVTGSPRFADS